MPARRIITLTTDFGLSDFYVAAKKAVLLRHNPSATIIDITHNVPRHDILCGSVTLERAIDGFPPGTIHLAVVDPGVGTHRGLLIVRINKSIVLCPDNGLITWAWHRHQPASVRQLTWQPKSASATFHGRDILAPVAAMIAAGRLISHLSRPILSPILLNVQPAQSRRGQIIQIDHFGNATTNIPIEFIRSYRPESIHLGPRKIGPLHRTYADVPPGHPIALINSSGLLEIAIRDGSAAKKLRLRVGDTVQLARKNS